MQMQVFGMLEAREDGARLCMDRILIVKRYSEGRISSNIDVQIWVLVTARWERGYGTQVRWVERDNERQNIGNEETRRAAHQNGEQVNLTAWKGRRREAWRTSVLGSGMKGKREGRCRQMRLDDLKCSRLDLS